MVQFLLWVCHFLHGGDFQIHQPRRQDWALAVPLCSARFEIQLRWERRLVKACLVMEKSSWQGPEERFGLELACLKASFDKRHRCYAYSAEKIPMILYLWLLGLVSSDWITLYMSSSRWGISDESLSQRIQQRSEAKVTTPLLAPYNPTTSLIREGGASQPLKPAKPTYQKRKQMSSCSQIPSWSGRLKY